MAKISRFATSKEAELQGTWVEAGAGLKLKIARLQNTNYMNYLQQAGKPLRPALRHGNTDKETTAELKTLTRKAIARHVLLGWENLQDDTGENVTYSVEKAEEFLEQYPDFYEMVIELANDAENFRIRTQEDSLGNS